MSFRFEACCVEDSVEIRLFRRRRLVGRPELRRPDAWTDLPPALAPLIRRLRGLEQDGRAVRFEDGLRVDNDTAAALPETVAAALGLPPQASVMLNVSVRGTIGQPDCHIETRWSDSNYRPIEPRRNGVELAWGTRSGRLSGPLFALVVAIDAFNAFRDSELDARVALWARFQATLARVNPDLVNTDDYAKALTIFQAGSFSLEVTMNADGVDFTPVLMSREKGRSLEDDAPGAADLTDEDDGSSATETDLFSTLRSQDADSLLVKHDRQAFQRQFDAPGSGVKAAYVLDRRRSAYVLLDPDLRRALEVVKRVRGGTEDEKRNFIRNPRPEIARALDLEDEEVLVTALFVETSQYSDRVIGLGLWERPELSWLSKASTTWVPETFPVRVGETDVEIGRDEKDELKKRVERAEQKGEQEVLFQDKMISLDEARRIIQEWEDQEAAAPPPEEYDEPEGTSVPEGLAEPNAPPPLLEPPPGGPLVIKIETNFDGVAYEIALKQRKALIPAAPPPEKMGRTRFKPHQEEGFAWLLDSWTVGWPGVLLADDMGLGKSFQSLAFLAWIRANREAARAQGIDGIDRGPVLIVAPTALLQNWIKEADLHLAHGALGERINAFDTGLKRLRKTEPDGPADDALDLSEVQVSDGWILTTYETLARNQRSFARIRFSVALFDEMQKIKDPGSLNTFAAKAMNADFVLGLTGTPVENRIEDLWSIMDRIVPGHLGDLKGFSAKHANADEDMFRTLKDRLVRPHESTPPILLRRMKEDNLKGLPAKEVKSYRVDMPDPQAEAYDGIIREARTASAANRNAMLEVIQKLRSVSLHPDGPVFIDLDDPAKVRDWVARSARLGKTIDILREVESRNEKALVFIEHRNMQDRFARALTTLFELEATPAIINGSVPGSKRQELVDGFQKVPGRFGLMILSPKAAGIGLTITAANHVIHLSRWWNPAVEDQCNDRVYRIGQDRRVTIHVPLAIHPQWGDHTFDVTLDKLLERKRTLSRTLLAPPVAEEDVDQLFKATVTE